MNKIMKSHGNWWERQKELGIKLAIVLLSGAWLILVAASWSKAATNEDYNFSWLDPDKKIYVLQNRKFTKANHLVISAMAGPGMQTSYRTSYGIEPRMAYYFSESLGIEAFFSYFTNSENNAFGALKIAAPNTLPVVREIRSQYGGLIQYVPWYAKINVFNKILYFDWYFSGGLGNLNSALDVRKNAAANAEFINRTSLALFVGTGHQYHLSQSFLVRIDFTGAFYRAPLLGNTGENTWFSSYLFGAGIGLKL